ncbi:MAG TPA: hypothetical protein ENG42_00515 [Candidatus Aenigmarchaeota archaeon]|nr:MAG: hypothetical protein DRP03_02815 [Candidatus Aenigmarchaeota archaeon]HDD45934.1 hypothetical protein [Candidatus Aenigmarchaeota archaeon]
MKKEIEKRIKDGWINSWMMIEAMAMTEAVARNALEKHIKKMENEEGVIVYEKKFGEAKRIEKPFANIKEAYSQVVELLVLTRNYDKLLYIVMNYAPSAIEILEPAEIILKVGEAQAIANSLAALIHKFAAAGAGGIIVSS